MAYEKYAGAYTKKIKYNNGDSNIIISGRIYLLSPYKEDNYIEAANTFLYYHAGENEFKTELIANEYDYLTSYAIIDNINFVGSIFNNNDDKEEEEILPNDFYDNSPTCIINQDQVIDLPSSIRIYNINVTDYFQGCFKGFSISHAIEDFAGINTRRVKNININISGLKRLHRGIELEPNNLPNNSSYIINGTLENVEVIETEAFMNFNGEDLREYKLGANLKEIQADAFCYCPNLKYITENNYFECDFKYSLNSYSYIFRDCPKIEVLSFGNNSSINGMNLGSVEDVLNNLEDAYNNGEEINTEQYKFNSLIYIPRYTGSNQDEEGYQIIEINTNNAMFVPVADREVGSKYTLFTIPIGMNYRGGYINTIGKVPTVVGSELIKIQAGLNKVIVIKSYPDGNYVIPYGNKLKRVRIVSLDNVKASPWHIAINNEIKAISY